MKREDFNVLIRRKPNLLKGGVSSVIPATVTHSDIGALPSSCYRQGTRKPLLPQDAPATATGRGIPARFNQERSKLEARFYSTWQTLRGPALLKEAKFHPTRQWRFDFFRRDKLGGVAIECEGGCWSGGRHVRGAGFIHDCQKYNAAASFGILVFRLTGELIKTETLITIMRVMEERMT